MKRGARFTSVSWNAPTYGPHKTRADSLRISAGLRGRISWNFPLLDPSAP
jgi:hypothetical protein